MQVNYQSRTRALSSSFYHILARAVDVINENQRRYVPPSTLEGGVRDISLSLKGRIFQSLLMSASSGASLHNFMTRWWVNTHPQFTRSSVIKILITARITPAIAVYRLKYMAGKIAEEKQKRYTQKRVRELVETLEKLIISKRTGNLFHVFHKIKTGDESPMCRMLIYAYNTKVREAYHILKERLLVSKAVIQERKMNSLMVKMAEILRVTGENGVRKSFGLDTSKLRERPMMKEGGSFYD